MEIGVLYILGIGGVVCAIAQLPPVKKMIDIFVELLLDRRI